MDAFFFFSCYAQFSNNFFHVDFFHYFSSALFLTLLLIFLTCQLLKSEQLMYLLLYLWQRSKDVKKARSDLLDFHFFSGFFANFYFHFPWTLMDCILCVVRD